MFVTDVDCENLEVETDFREEAFRQAIPADLDRWEPGPRLAAVLSSLDRSRLSGYDLIVVMRARSRQVAHDQAELLADMAEVSYCIDDSADRSEEPLEYAADEIRAALTMTRRAAEAELDFAIELRDAFPWVWETLQAGHIDVRKAKTIVHGVAHMDPEAGAHIAEHVLSEAASLTTGQLRARIQRLCIDFDPEEATKRYTRRVEERRVETTPNPEGTVDLNGRDLPPNKVAAARGHIESLARCLRRAGDERTMDQIRADVFLDLLLGKGRGASPSGVITMTGRLETLAGLAEQAAEIPGIGPVIADVARQVLAENPDAEFRYKIIADNGDVIIGTPSRFATKTLRRFLETRDTTCVGPGCRMPATECDIDHRKRHVDGGLTNDRDNQPLCRHDHMVKDSGGWRLTRDPDGTYTWISRLGHTYRTGLPP